MTKSASRLGDCSECSGDGHGCPSCPHHVTGQATTGSDDVLINSRPALRVGDTGSHSKCCGLNEWVAIDGSKSVLINDREVCRKGDSTEHCGGNGRMIEGSVNVIVGDWSGSGNVKNNEGWIGLIPALTPLDPRSFEEKAGHTDESP